MKGFCAVIESKSRIRNFDKKKCLLYVTTKYLNSFAVREEIFHLNLTNIRHIKLSVVTQQWKWRSTVHILDCHSITLCCSLPPFCLNSTKELDNCEVVNIPAGTFRRPAACGRRSWDLDSWIVIRGAFRPPFPYASPLQQKFRKKKYEDRSPVI